MPGLISHKVYVSDDGERCSVIEFDSAESLAAWRDPRRIWRDSKPGENATMRIARLSRAEDPRFALTGVGTMPNKSLQRSTNSSFLLTSGGAWRHTGSLGSGPAIAVTGR